MRRLLMLIAVAMPLTGCSFLGGAGGSNEHVVARPVAPAVDATPAAARQTPDATASTGKVQATAVEVKPAAPAPAVPTEQSAIEAKVATIAQTHWIMSDHGLPLVAAAIIVLSVCALLISHLRRPHPVNGHAPARRPNGEVAARHLQL